MRPFSLFQIYKAFVCGLVFTFCHPLVAWIEPKPGSIVLQGDLLYWTPSYDETYFVINGGGSDGLGNAIPNGKRINNPIGYNLGFRVEGAYGIPNTCVDVRLRWTHLYATSTTIVSNFDPDPQLWPIEGIPVLVFLEPYTGTARSHIGLMYQRGECLVDENLWSLPCWYFSLRQGIEWSYIRYHEKVDYIEVLGMVQKNQYHGHTKGIGPQLGIIALFDPCGSSLWFPKNLSLKFITTATLIAANSKAKVKVSDFATTNKVTQSSFWRLVPEWNIGAGLNYTCCIGACSASVELGYELTTYIRGLSKLIFDDVFSPGHSFNQYSDFYVHGLYLNFGFLF